MEVNSLGLDKESKEKLKKQIIRFYLEAKGGVIRYKGNSMLPVLEKGCKVNIKPIDYRRINIGEIIAFADNNNDKIIVHRIIGKIRMKNGKQLFFLEKGDNSFLIGFRPQESVIGKVTKVNSSSLEVNVSLWRKNNYILILLSYFFCSLYTILSKMKGAILKEEMKLLNKYLFQIYWKSCFLVLRMISKNDKKRIGNSISFP